MSAHVFNFSIGAIACTVLLDGAAPVDLDRFLRRFPEAGEAEYRQAFAEIGLSIEQADSSFNILLARTHDEIVLIDSGEGGKPAGGQLRDSLRAAGYTPDDITLVVITHAHGDHVLGLLDSNDAPLFPRARYVISQEELCFWEARIDDSAAEQRPIVEMMRARGLNMIDMDQPICAGLTAVPIPGHTPGQIAVLIESEGQRLIHLADLLHSPIQFGHPEWSARFDADTSRSVPTRRQALGRAADEQMLALFYHLRFPGLGRITRAERGFTWQPVSARESAR